MLENAPEIDPVDPNSRILELAFSFIEFSKSNLFITGKAGSGKTFFLSEQSKKTAKNHVILAPTGIAAVNANGVTLNSLFQIPPGIFIDGELKSKKPNVYSISELLLKLNYTVAKKEFLRNLELIFIDEVSMLRSDQVTLIDAILKDIRHNDSPFGGVQMIFIGDLFQLPPIVQNDLSVVFFENYKSQFFFDSKVLQDHPFIQIELPHVHRQSDTQFVDVLNKVRTNQITGADLQWLNARIKGTSEERHLTTSITSHNEEANEINQQRLSEINANEKIYYAEISGDYKDAHITAEKILKLKTGAQVMLIRNDNNSLKKYYNGKLAVVTDMKENSVMIRFEDKNEIEIERSLWETSDYNPESGRVEVVGKLKQFPLKLAWAVTIHKSQGLTFEHAEIDAAKSFAPGQVYVALSRVKSYHGIRLLSRLTANSIQTNSRIASYLNPALQDKLFIELSRSKISYWLHLLCEKFNLTPELIVLNEILNKPDTLKQNIEIKTLLAFQDLDKFLNELQTVFYKFRNELYEKFGDTINEALINERIGKAQAYFVGKIDKSLLTLNDLWSNLNSEKSLTAKTIVLLKGRMSTRISEIRAVSLIMRTYSFQGIEEAIKLSRESLSVTPEVKNKPEVELIKKKKLKKSLQLSTDLLKAGKTISEISAIRKLSISTIENHLLEAAKTGENITVLIMDQDDIQALQKHIREVGSDILDLKEKLGEKYSFFQLRLMIIEYTSGK